MDKTERMIYLELLFQRAISHVSKEIEKLDQKSEKYSLLEQRLIDKLGLRSNSMRNSYYNSTSAFPARSRLAARSPGDFSFSNNEGDDTTTFSFGEIDENIEVGNTGRGQVDSIEFEALLSKPDRSESTDKYNFRNHQVVMVPYIYEPRKSGCEKTYHYPISIGDMIAERYRIDCIIAQTTFSTVIECYDSYSKEQVCLKVIHNQKETLDQGLDEIKMMRHLSNKSINLQIVQLIDFFYYKEHLFLVTELLGENLYMIMSHGEEGKQLLINNLKYITESILRTLDFIHNQGIIHADVKPENILSVKKVRKQIHMPQQIDVKLVDFGSSCFITDELTPYIQSKAYRAPEVLMGSAYDCKIDIWSLGCIIAEILSGDPLLYWETIEEALVKIRHVIGQVPKDGKLIELYINSDGTIKGEDQIGIPSCKTLKQIARHDPLLLDFLRKLLCVDPTLRPSASEALSHPWLHQISVQFNKYYCEFVDLIKGDAS